MIPWELALRAVCRDRGSRRAASLTAISSAVTTVLVVLLLGVLHAAGLDLARGQRMGRLDIGLLPLIGTVLLVALSLVLFALVVRRTGAKRQHRLGALRASGATPRQQVAPVAVEVLSVSAAGTLGGVLIVRSLRSLATRVLRDGGVWLADVAPSPGITAAAGIGVPLLAVFATLAGLRPRSADSEMTRLAGGELSAARRSGRGPRVLARARGPRTW